MHIYCVPWCHANANAGIVVASLNLVALIVHFCVDKFVVNQSPWDHAYIRDFVSFIISSITILVIAIPEGLPVAVMVSLAYSVKVRHFRRYVLRASSAVPLVASVRVSVCLSVRTKTEKLLIRNLM